MIQANRKQHSFLSPLSRVLLIYTSKNAYLVFSYQAQSLEVRSLSRWVFSLKDSFLASYLFLQTSILSFSLFILSLFSVIDMISCFFLFQFFLNNVSSLKDFTIVGYQTFGIAFFLSLIFSKVSFIFFIFRSLMCFSFFVGDSGYIQFLQITNNIYINIMEGEKGNLQLIRGSLWGAVLGDVIGAYLQFNHSIDKQKVESAFLIKGGGMHKLQPGQPTDDSQLAYSVGKGLIKGKHKLNLNMIAAEMGNWFQSKPIDVGNTIRKSVPKAVNMKVHQAHLCRKGAKQNSQKSQSNGTLMAITPLSIWCFRLSSQDLIKTVKEYTILVHSNELVSFANAFYTLGLCYLLRNPKSEKRNTQAFQFAKNQIKPVLEKSNNGDQFKSWILTIQKCLQDPQIIEKECSPTKKSGWVRVALTLAYRELLKGKSFKESIKNILKQKGDTDTNACIAGGLIGAFYGFQNIESELGTQVEKIRNWRPKIVNRPEWLVPGIVLQNIANRLAEYAPTQLQVVGGYQEYNKK